MAGSGAEPELLTALGDAAAASPRATGPQGTDRERQGLPPTRPREVPARVYHHTASSPKPKWEDTCHAHHTILRLRQAAGIRGRPRAWAPCR